MRRRYLVVPSLLCIGLAVASCTAEPETPPGPASPALVEFDPPGPKDPDLAANAAVLIGSCLSSGGDVFNPQSLLGDLYYRVRPRRPLMTAIERITHCIAGQPEGCKTLERCFATTIIPRSNSEPCEKACLSNNVGRSCFEFATLETECARLGMACGPDGCSTDPVLEPCDTATADLCEGNTPRHCPQGAPGWQGIRCSDYDLVCGVIHDGPEPWSVCQGTGPACTELYDYSEVRFVPDLGCEGTTARTCMNYREHVFDCGMLAKGFTCQAAQSEVFCGLASECVSGNSATCDGDDVVLCNGGRLDRINCKALGFEGCDPDVGLCYPSPASQR